MALSISGRRYDGSSGGISVVHNQHWQNGQTALRHLRAALGAVVQLMVSYSPTDTFLIATASIASDLAANRTMELMASRIGKKVERLGSQASYAQWPVRKGYLLWGASVVQPLNAQSQLGPLPFEVPCVSSSGAPRLTAVSGNIAECFRSPMVTPNPFVLMISSNKKPPKLAARESALTLSTSWWKASS